MKIILDLNGCASEEELFKKFDEVFELGGELHVDEAKGWGMNWDAFNDCLRSLEEGGIWGSSKKFGFPLEIEIIGLKNLQDLDPDNARILQKIFANQINEYKEQGKILKIFYR